MQSIESLNLTKAASEAFEFQYVPSSFQGDPNSIPEEKRIYLSVLGSQSEVVVAEIAKMVNERRRAAAAREIASKVGVGRKKVEFDTQESDIAFGQRLAAVRLVGWRGISDPWTPENALRLCQVNQDVAAQVTIQSDEMGNFLKS